MLGSPGERVRRALPTSILHTVASIWRYPVSSVGGEALDRADLGSTGVAGDRRWCLADAASGEVAAPEKRKRWRPAPEILARGTERLEVQIGSGPWLPAFTAEADESLRHHFGFAVEILPAASDDDTQEPGAVRPRYRREPVHLVTTASLAALSRLLPDSAIDSRRFRPNLVIDTGAEANGFIEQSWLGGSFALGGARLLVTEPCRRCAFTVIGQRDLAVDPAILAEIQSAAGGSFGVMCRVTSPGLVGVGDAMVPSEASQLLS